MMTGRLFINDVDAWTEWKVFLEEGSLDKLLLPPAQKLHIENKSRSDNGKQVLIKNQKLDDRDVTLVFCFSMSNFNPFPPYTGNDVMWDRRTLFIQSFIDTENQYVNVNSLLADTDACLNTFLDNLSDNQETADLRTTLTHHMHGFLQPYLGTNMEAGDFCDLLYAHMQNSPKFAFLPDFDIRLELFMNAILSGRVHLGKIYPTQLGIGDWNKIFNLNYLSSVELSSMGNKMGKIAIRFNEPDPSTRPRIDR